MDLELNEEQRLLRDNARRFLEREVAPLVAEWEARGALPDGLYPRLVEPGFVGATVPASAGGHGLELTSYLVLVEELAYCWGSLRSSVTHGARPEDRCQHQSAGGGSKHSGSDASA
jgi:alkylation response protein AidB-like acyl-CoA dehydrogenase